MNDSIKKSVTQVLLIVFSVVLGLYLSERIEERKNEKDAAKLLSKIKSELNENKKLLDVWVPYHAEVVKTLDSLTKSEVFIENFIKDKSAVYQAFSKGTIMSDMPSNDSWEIAKNHPLIVNFEYDELLVLSKIYNQQEVTYLSVPKLIDLMVSTEFNAKETARPNLELFKSKLEEIYGREVQLVNYYNNAENLLNFEDNTVKSIDNQ